MIIDACFVLELRRLGVQPIKAEAKAAAETKPEAAVSADAPPIASSLPSIQLCAEAEFRLLEAVVDRDGREAAAKDDAEENRKREFIEKRYLFAHQRWVIGREQPKTCKEIISSFHA
jgi:hypothetical protein